MNAEGRTIDGMKATSDDCEKEVTCRGNMYQSQEGRTESQNVDGQRNGSALNIGQEGSAKRTVKPPGTKATPRQKRSG